MVEIVDYANIAGFSAVTYATAKEAAIEAAKQSSGGALAEPYDATATYTAGQYASVDGDVYKCTTAITEPEEWNPNHWTKVYVMNEIGGSASGDKSFVFTQAEPASVWSITHNLGKYPSVTVVDSAGTQLTGKVTYNSFNAVTISFNTAVLGKAFMN